KIVVLRDGRVEQVGSPMELYNNPANQFVAGFLGSPSMNFFPAGVLTAGDRRTMGIRPEDLFVADDGPLKVHVSHVEHLGGDTNIIAHMNDHQITARLFGQHQVAAGEDLRLGFKPDCTYAFDEGGARVS
ncbi:MAG: TOBE domain-containing protein, partial [Pseudomonadota bacterium]